MPLFQVVDIDRKFAAEILTGFIARGSTITGVDVNMINVTVTSLPISGTKVDTVWLCAHGMPIFDAITWVCADVNIRPRLRLKDNAATFAVLSSGVIAKALFFCYFYLLTQARYPTREEDPLKVPSFLRNVAGLTEPAGVYLDRICSFNPVLFDARWIRDVKFNGFGQEVLSRFGLGVAGYRMFAPFKLLQPRADLNAIAVPAYNYARTIAQSAPTWNVHPVTRAPELLSERGNLNKNLSNLMLHCFSAEQLTVLAQTKVLYEVPKRHIGFDNWQQ